MKFNVLKPFKNYDGSFLKTNDVIDCDENQAKALIRNRMIGNYQEKAIEKKVEIPEKDYNEKTIEFTPKRKYRKHKK